ncbi:MAG: putative manganese-dependent inorganic diphosphatase [Acidobacteria bacterium]|nr:putative manganese-dependent inorganic diphosphatase [Acidobacteriota bacterium]
MNNIVYIFGHKNPDTDSICSAIGYAELKNRLSTGTRYLPCRLGAPNPQTRWVLERAGVPAPRHLSDTHIRVQDLMTREVQTVDGQAPLAETIELIQKKRIRIVPVTRNDGTLQGMVTFFSLSDHLLHVTSPESHLQAVITLKNLIRVLHGKILAGKPDSAAWKMDFMVAVMGSFSFSKDLERRNPAEVLLFTADRNDIIRLAIEAGVRAIIVTGGNDPGKEAIAAAKEAGVVLIATDFYITQALNLGKLSIPAALAAERGDIQIPETMLKSEAKRKLLGSHHRGLAVVDEENRVIGIVTRSDLLKNVQKKVILMDHNEAGQSVTGLHEAEILEVLDHHRIGSFSTETPITYLCKPTGSTCTIVAGLYRDSGQTPDKKTALILLSGVLSDTIIFRSPTCTGTDRETAGWLAQIAGVSPEEYGMEMFKASSAVAGLSDNDLIRTDMKEFTEKDIRFSISQVEVVEFNEIKERSTALLKQLEQIRKANGYLFSALLVTNIVAGDSLLLFAGEAEIIAETGFAETSPGIRMATGIISRKKQLLPLLLGIIKEWEKGQG